MQLRPDQAATYVQTHHGVLGAGWKEVDAFEDLVEDEDEYEDKEVEEYVTLDLGNGMDGRYLQTESTLQLIGLDTALPHLKIGNMVLQGEITPLIGSEVILGLIRNQENPHNPSHPPLYTTSNRITFRPITLSLKAQAQADPTQTQILPAAPAPVPATTAEEEGRSMFLLRPAKNGPNRPEVFPGRQRDVIRAERKRARAEARARGEAEMSPDKPDDDEDDDGMEVDVEAPGGGHILQFDTETQTPGAGPSTFSATALPPLDTVVDDQAAMFATGPRSSGKQPRGGRPRTRPLLEIHSEAQLKSVNLGVLPDNVRILVLPAAISPESPESFSGPPTSLEFNKAQFRRFIGAVPPSGPGSRPRSKYAGGEKGRAGASIIKATPRPRQVIEGSEPLLLTVPADHPSATAPPGAGAASGEAEAEADGEDKGESGMQVDEQEREDGQGDEDEDEPLREVGELRPDEQAGPSRS